MPEGCLLLIRHAQSANNAKPDCERVADPDITQLGIEQSKLLASSIDRYSPTRLYCSPFLRAIQTLQPVVAATGLTPIVRQDIYEQGGCHRGFRPGERIAERGMTRSQLQALCPGWSLDDRITEQGWNDNDSYETIDDARRRAKRVRNWFEDQRKLHASHRVAMMIHADWKLRLLEAFLEFEDLDAHFIEPINTSISCLVWNGRRWQLDYWNQFTHLPPSHVSS